MRSTMWVIISAAAGVTGVASGSVLTAPTVQVDGLTHGYARGVFAPGFAISDAAKAGQFTQTSFTSALSANDSLSVRFSAAAGSQFQVTRAPGLSSETLVVGAAWSAAGSNTQHNLMPTIQLENLTGTAPTLITTDTVCQAGNWIWVRASLNVTGPFEFTGVTFSAPYTSSWYSGGQTFDPVASDFHFSVSGNDPSPTAPDVTLMKIVPEPGILLLGSAGAMTLVGRRRRDR